MDYIIENLKPFKVIGFCKKFNNKEGYEEIPKYWDKISNEYFKDICNGKSAKTDIEKAILENNIGEFGICIDEDLQDEKFTYMIAGKYQGGNIPEGLKIFEFPELKWAKFKSIGPLPQALQDLNTKIFKEWLPNNNDYRLVFNYNIEWYSNKDMDSSNYESAIWLPVKEKY